MGRKRRPLLALLMAAAVFLTACGEKEQGPDHEEPMPLALTVSVAGTQDTLDPASVTAQGGEMILHHLYENLMRWEDDGSGWAVLAPGQAESYAVETDFAGNATYTFTLREDASWSDGRAVTSVDFANAWRRLADPANDLPHRELLSAVSGYDEVQETGDVSLLAVSAPDERTFVVALKGSCAWFLEEICAGAWTMPVREDLAFDGTVTNGAYTASGFSSTQVVLERNERYYNQARLGPDSITFLLSAGAEEDYRQFTAGGCDLITSLPDNVYRERAASGGLPEPVTAFTAVLLNTQQPPFDDPDVRLAFRLAVDSQAVADALDGCVRGASGVIPYGVADYAERPAAGSAALPVSGPASEGVVETPPFRDFRTHSLEIVTSAARSGYAEDCQRARDLLARAGYPGGSGFPETEYIYVDSGAGQSAAAALRAMWWENLGIIVTVRGLSQDEYNARLSASFPVEDDSGSGAEDDDGEAVAPFMMAAQDISAVYSDAGVLLGRWHSASPENYPGFRSDAFDILLNAAQAAVSAGVRDAYLHDAEAILLDEAPVIPVYCQGGSYLLREGLTGLYRAPDGVYFLYAVSAV